MYAHYLVILREMKRDKIV